MSFKKNNKKKAELSTILTIGAFVFIGVSSIISVVFSPQRTITKTRASEILSDACKQRVDNKVYVFFKRNGARPVCSVDQIKQGTPSDPIDSWLVDETKNCTTNSNCGDGAWCYFFENKASKARCMTRDLSCDNGVCLSASSGSSNNNSSQNFGNTTQPAQGGNQSGFPSQSSSNSCFSIGADFEVRNDGDRKAFYSWVTFRSQTPGSLSLYFNNVAVAGPNSFEGGEFTYNPAWTQHFTHSNEAPAVVLSKGQSNSIWYRGVHSGCSQAQVIDINCNLSYDNNGSTIVSGAGCSCRNCQIFSPPATPTPRSPSNRSPGTSSRSSITQTPTLTPTLTVQPTLINQIKKQNGESCKSNSECISNYCSSIYDGGTCQPNLNYRSSPVVSTQTLTQIPTPSNLGKLNRPCRNTEPRCDEGLVCTRVREEMSINIFICTKKIIPSLTPTPFYPNPTIPRIRIEIGIANKNYYSDKKVATPTLRPTSNRNPETSLGSRITPIPTLTPILTVKPVSTSQIKKQNGEFCRSNSECISNYCELMIDGGICQTHPNNKLLATVPITTIAQLTKTPTPIQTLTPKLTLTLTPTLTSTLNRCEILPNNFINRVGYLDCPKEEILNCNVINGKDGKRYMKAECGKGDKKYCSFSCKDINDLLADRSSNTNYYRHNCSHPETCINESVNKISRKIGANIKISFINVDSCIDEIIIHSIGFGIKDGDNIEQYISGFPGLQERPISWFIKTKFNNNFYYLSKYDDDFDPDIKIFPIDRKILIRPFIGYKHINDSKDVPINFLFGNYKEIYSLDLFAQNQFFNLNFDCSSFNK